MYYSSNHSFGPQNKHMPKWFKNSNHAQVVVSIYTWLLWKS